MILKEEGKDLTLLALDASKIKTFDFETGSWSTNDGQALLNGKNSYTAVPFLATDDLVVAPFLTPGYALYNISSQQVVMQLELGKRLKVDISCTTPNAK